MRLTQVSAAVAPVRPSSPNVPLNLALGGLVGLALGIGVGATIAAVVIWRKGHRRRSRAEGHQDKPSVF